MSLGQEYFLVWLALSSVGAFLLFGVDKWLAGRRGAGRISESALCWAGALGGWPGGLLGILVFRHKSAKGTFQLKYALALLAWALIAWAAWEWL